jgi:hypothetical protein
MAGEKLQLHEFHESFHTSEFIMLLREHDIGLVCADTVE